MSLKQKVISAIKWSALAKVTTQIISWLSTIFVMRLLDPVDYGLMAMSMVLITIFSIFADLGLGSALVQAKNISQDHERKIFGTAIVVSIIITIFIIIMAPLAAEFYNEPRLSNIIRLISLHFLISVISLPSESRLKRELKYKELSIAEGASSVLAAVCSLGFAYYGWGVWSLVYSMLIGAVLRTAILLFTGGRLIFPIYSFNGIIELTKFGGLMTVNSAIASIFTQADIFVAGKFLTREALGFYSVSLHLATLPIQKAMMIVNQIAFSGFSRIQDDKVAVTKGLGNAIKIGAYISFPLLWGLAVVANDFVILVLGIKWIEAVIPLQIICIAMPFRMFSILNHTVVCALGRADIALQNSITGIIILPACFLYGAQFGAIGLATGWIVGLPVVVLLNIRRSFETTGFGIKSLFLNLWRPVISSVFMTFSIIIIGMILGKTQEPLINFVSNIIIGIFSFAIALYIFDRKTLSVFCKNIVNRSNYKN